MPVLARTIEAAGIATVVVTMMPYWSSLYGVPRTLGVEFPFGQPFGMPKDDAGQRAVLRAALDLLENAAPGIIVAWDRPWPQPIEEARRTWHPPDPSPLIAYWLQQPDNPLRPR